MDKLFPPRTTARCAGSARRRLLAAGACTVASVLVLGCGSARTSAQKPRHPSTAAPATSGSFVANGHELFLECVGQGKPTMVLEVGEGRLHGDLVRVQEVYKPRMRVCSYDRANKGASKEAATPRTGADVVADLHELLRAAKVPGPYLLVGHSAGGLIAMAYAATHPDDVVGLVAINPVAPWKAWLPVMADMTPSERREEVAFQTGTNGESLNYKDISRVVDGPVPTTIPASFLVSSAVECPPGDAACSEMIARYDVVMRQVARRWGSAPLTVVDASHDIQFDDIDAVTTAIDDVLARAS